MTSNAFASRFQRHAMGPFIWALGIGFGICSSLASAQTPGTTPLPWPANDPAARPQWKFDFGGKAADGFISVPSDTRYNANRGYGFDLGSTVQSVIRGGDDPMHDGFVTSAKPLFFSADVPEGNYHVTITLGDLQGPSVATVKAEQRRLMLEKVETAPGKFETRTIEVSVRSPRIAGGGQIRLKAPRELGYLNWDNKLTLEFSNTYPCVCAIEIEKADDLVTLFLAGDSTMTDQGAETYNSWGQMLPRFFKQGLVVANYAESGETAKSFVGEKRWAKVMSMMKPGDFLLVQFGHNDQKDKTPNYAMTGYKDVLKRFITDVRQKGGTPVVVTPMNRRTFDESGKSRNDLGDFPQAVRDVAKEQNVSLIDLNAMSMQFYEALGPKEAPRAFANNGRDSTHHDNYGSYELARCIVEGIQQNHLEITKFLADDVKPFDPANPDPVDQFAIPADPIRGTSARPEGN
ncbi:MAG: rhamnogalacturonan acetylesterase [Planctomycetota bacterium]|nr:rhamnogalacturonan acetylesterase [Planctomycetota bacterium]